MNHRVDQALQPRVARDDRGGFEPAGPAERTPLRQERLDVLPRPLDDIGNRAVHPDVRPFLQSLPRARLPVRGQEPKHAHIRLRKEILWMTIEEQVCGVGHRSGPGQKASRRKRAADVATDPYRFAVPQYVALVQVCDLNPVDTLRLREARPHGRLGAVKRGLPQRVDLTGVWADALNSPILDTNDDHAALGVGEGNKVPTEILGPDQDTLAVIPLVLGQRGTAGPSALPGVGMLGIVSAMPDAMLLVMKTTVSVEGELRDRLAALATRHGRTMGEQIAAMVEAAEEQEFWDGVSAGYTDLHHADLDVELHDDYPEYAHLRTGEIPAEGAHNEEPSTSARQRRTAA